MNSSSNDPPLNLDFNSTFGIGSENDIYHVGDNLMNLIESSSDERLKQNLNTYNDFGDVNDLTNDESVNLIDKVITFSQLDDSTSQIFPGSDILNPSNSNILTSFTFSDFQPRNIERDSVPDSIGERLRLDNTTDGYYEKEFTVQFKCKFCGKAFTDEDEAGRKAHVESHINNDASSSQANEPSQVIKPKVSAVPRVRSRFGHRELRRKFVCSVDGCDFVAKVRTHLRDHLLRHEGIKPIQCDVPGCQARFINRSSLNTHKKTHQGSAARTFQCAFPGCSGSFTKRSNLNTHMRMHTDEKPFSCKWPGCPESFRTKQNMKNHLEAAHLDSRKHLCTVCNQSFNTSSNLKQHQASHTKDPKIVCDWPGCSFRACTTAQVTSHKRKHEKSFSCKVCDKQFGRRIQLEHHNKAHHSQSLSTA